MKPLPRRVLQAALAKMKMCVTSRPFAFAYIKKELHYLPIYLLQIYKQCSWHLRPWLLCYHCFKSIILCCSQGFDIPAHYKSFVEILCLLLSTAILNQNISELCFIWHSQRVLLWKIQLSSSSSPSEIKETKQLSQSLSNSLDIHSKEFWIRLLTYFIFYTLSKALTKIFTTDY